MFIIPAAVSPPPPAARGSGGGRDDAWKIKKLGQSLLDARKLCIRCRRAFTTSAKHVNNATGHLTPFPPPRRTCLHWSISEPAVYIKKKEEKGNVCHLFPILPLLVFLSAQILLKPAAVAAAVETLKCDVCISSQLLKSLPLSLSPSVPFLSFFLSFSLHTWLSSAKPPDSMRNGGNTARRQLKYDTMILSRLRVSLQQCDISI